MGENILSVELNIEGIYDSFKPAEKKVADYVLQNRREIVSHSITRVAREAGVSEATIVKFCKTLGYSGFQELKILLARSEARNPVEKIYGEIEPHDDMETISAKIFPIYEESLNKTRELLNTANIDYCARKIIKARRLFFFGFGASGIVALDAEQKFKRIGYRAEAIIESHAQETQASLLEEGDLVIAISHSGRTVDLIRSLKLSQENRAEIIAITAGYRSPVADLAEKIIPIPSPETPFRGSAMASRLAQLVAVDCLFLGVVTREFDKAQKALSKTRVALSRTKT